MADVFLHIGLPKTGTTTIQTALEFRADTLAAKGVLFPGGTHEAQRLAAYALVGQRVSGEDPALVAGAFGRLLDEIREYDGPRIVVSEEELGLAQPRHVRRLIRKLSPHRVFVIVSVRDLGRTLVSAWQQSVVTGSTVRWRDYAAAVRDPGQGAVRAGFAYWAREDLSRVLNVWGACVPADRIRIVTVPPSGSPPQVLVERFTEAAELPRGILGAESALRNRGLGAAEVEVIRRVNEVLVGSLNKKQYLHVIRQGIRPSWKVEGSRALRLPDEDFSWVEEHSRAQIDHVRASGYPVYGDLNDLLPVTDPAGTRRLDDVSESELLTATEAALVSLALAHGGLFRRYRRAVHEQTGTYPGTAELLSGTVTAAEFRLRKLVLEGTERNRLLSWGVHTYLKRTSHQPR